MISEGLTGLCSDPAHAATENPANRGGQQLVQQSRGEQSLHRHRAVELRHAAMAI
jgi:hypothetical protein